MMVSETGLHYPLPLDTLPKDWQIGYVGDFAMEIQPGFASGKHNKEGKGIPHIRPYNIDRNGQVDLTEIKYVAPEADRKRLRSNDVLFNNTNSPELVGKTAVISKVGDWGFSNHMTRIVFKDAVSPKFAAYQLNYLWSRGYFLHNCVKHVNQASVSSSALGKTVPFIAPPRDQQEQIVAEIEKQFSRLDEAVAGLKRVKANLKRYKAAVLKAAVEGRLVETEAELARREGRSYETGEQLLKRILEERRRQWNGKGKNKESAAPDTAGLPELPEGWVWTTMPQLGELNRGKSKHRPRDDKKLYGGPYPFIQTGDIRKSQGSITEYNQTYSEFGLKQSRLWPVGTLCITIAANIAETGILKFSACFPDSVVGFLIEDDVTITRYIEYFIRTAQEKLERFAPATAQKNINLEVLNAVAIPLPPIAEQQRVIAEIDRHVSIMHEMETQVETNLRRSERFRQAILSKAFSGCYC